MRLKIDVQQSSVESLTSECKHQSLELKETREMLKIYELKCEELIKQLGDTNTELNSNKRLMIGYSQSQQEKSEKIAMLKAELD